MNAPAAINRASRIPATSEITQCRLSVRLFDPAPFCAAPIPSQKRRMPIAVSAIIGAALWRPHYAYGILDAPESQIDRAPSRAHPAPGALRQLSRELPRWGREHRLLHR